MKEMEQANLSLKDMKTGETGTVASLGEMDLKNLQKLLALGILPGSKLTLLRKFPSFVFRMGHSEISVDSDLAKKIFVR